MSIYIKRPVFLHEVGKRPNNEDAIYPKGDQVTARDRLFIVCDGVGGANKGEVASSLSCEFFARFFAENHTSDVNEGYLTQALQFVEAKLSEHIAKHPDCANMATTLTLAYLDNELNRAVIAWIGDSKIYHVRTGNILFESDDHSLVNELLKRGEITADEARVHPQRNMILRAISGSDQPTTIDVHVINDLKVSDYILLCTDGITESIDNRILATLLHGHDVELPEARDKIKELCAQYSNDNHSMYLLKVDALTKERVATNKTQPIENYMPDARSNQRPAITYPTTEIEKTNRKMLYGLATLALSLILFMAIYYLVTNTDGTKKQYTALIEEAQQLAKQENLDSLEDALGKYRAAASLLPDGVSIKKQDTVKLKKKIVTKQELMALEALRQQLSVATKDSILKVKHEEIDSNFIKRIPAFSKDSIHHYLVKWGVISLDTTSASLPKDSL